MLNEKQISNLDNQKTKGVKNIPYKVLGGVILIVVVGLIIAYFTGFFDKNNDDVSKSADNSEVQQSNMVARVDGQPITQSDVDQRTQIIISSSQTPGTELTNDQLAQAQQIAFQQLVNEILISQAAQQNNITVSNEEVDAEFNNIVASYPDQQTFQQDLVANNVSEQDVKADIARQLAIQKYIDQNTDSTSIEVTEEEINSLYEQYSSQQEDVPALDEVRDQLQQQIFQDKLNQQVTQLLQTLQNAANIEILN